MTSRAWRTVILLAACLGLATLFVLTYWVGVRTEAGQVQDIDLFARLQHLPFGRHASLVRDGVPVLLGVAAVVLGGLALVQRRWRAALGALLITVASVVLAGALKPVLGRPYLGDNGYVENTFPSNHAAAAASLAIAVVLLWPWLASRPVVAVVATAAALLAGLYNVVGFAHRPADVLGAFLIAGAVGALVCAALDLPDRRPSHPGPLGSPR